METTGTRLIQIWRGEWIISGAMKINRFLTDAEVDSINEGSGFKDLPRDTPLDAEAYGIEIGKDKTALEEFREWQKQEQKKFLMGDADQTGAPEGLSLIHI